jgi:hypothetical protein
VVALAGDERVDVLTFTRSDETFGVSLPCHADTRR